MWSLACILAELYTGELLFPTHKDSEHLAMMKKVLGRMPSWMLKKAARRYKKYFDKDYRLLFPKGASDKTIRNVRNIPVLEVIGI
jgi:dual-specificity kinase